MDLLMERKLAAIFSADVQGYSRLMGEDEEGTVQTLAAYREMMASLIQQHRGRVVDSPGDNLLAEFANVVDAVQCAVAVQQELKVRNAELPAPRKMEFRIGINLGDVLVEGERLYGDGVNIAAHMEGLTEGGGICLSGTAYDQVKNKLALGYVPLGEHTVKNIKDPVQVYRVQHNATPSVAEAPRTGRRYWRRAALAAVAVLVVIAGGAAIWNVSLRRPPPAVEVASRAGIQKLDEGGGMARFTLRCDADLCGSFCIGTPSKLEADSRNIRTGTCLHTNIPEARQSLAAWSLPRMARCTLLLWGA